MVAVDRMSQIVVRESETERESTDDELDNLIHKDQFLSATRRMFDSNKKQDKRLAYLMQR